MQNLQQKRRGINPPFLLADKLYQHQFSRDNLAPEIQAYYAAAPQVYPDFQGGWQPHMLFVGEITDVRDDR